MKERIITCWGLRSAREQQMLAAMFVMLAVTLFLFGIIRPLHQALANARERHQSVVVSLAEARGQADLIRSIERSAPAQPQGPVADFISRAATEAGFTVDRLEQQGPDQADLTLGTVRPQAFFAWTSALERRHGLVVERLTARTNSDATLSVQLSIRKRRR
jgi:general secretion pathway protein M